ncbi:ATP-dependent sacrificial sulfur transferase LarE [Desulfoluna sp.]|uniref:ATP-dependent sacrificial sulfur transferase LarE n=1 Tax=Desulfoluna sp. TaxID=2045199 RepID=UPI002631620B|nr:ATP-dependent sacrificial sulfur transferase LarE [Desulfoluna sp.]
MESYLIRYESLLTLLKTYDSLAVAFSGGVDSTLLLKAAVEALGEKVVAITSVSPVHARREIDAARKCASALGVRHITYDPGMMDDQEFVENSPLRCYYCKRRMLMRMSKEAGAVGVSNVVHGVNCDDLSDYRPGVKAAEELGIEAPMVVAGLFKADIRALAEYLGLDVAHKPAMSCLATRIPYGEPITPEKLAMVEAAEAALDDLGFLQFRVRHHGPVARIEFSQDDLMRLFNDSLMAQVVAGVRKAGYLHVAADLEGYGQGRMNRVLKGS